MRWILAIILICWSVGASATKHRRPFNGNISLGYGFDNNGSASGCTDWGCGGTCYNTHTGSDFPLSVGTDVLAGAPGTVLTVVQGCADYGYLGNPCGGKCGNYVKLAHADGSHTIYCHMKNGSIVVNQGQSVSCGQKLGQSASSGSSTGPHLHFGWRPTGSYSSDPFQGSCSSTSGWVSQGSYPGKPSVSCEVTCACTAGQTQSQACGNCGTRTRTCGADCQWGGWSGCQAQGACAPGAGQSESCGNCGTRTRTCTNSCAWSSWSGCQGQGTCAPGATETENCCTCGQRSRTCSTGCAWTAWTACAGPDPTPAPPCVTGNLGACALGVAKCQDGCLVCEQAVSPSAELCDGTDNDCDGLTDEDTQVMGVEPPEFAARLVDLSIPTALALGDQSTAWFTFRNEGSMAWEAGSVWLAAEAVGGGLSPLWSSLGWSAWDAPAWLLAPVPPGGVGYFVFEVTMANDVTKASPGTRFVLKRAGVEAPCPEPDVVVSVLPLAESTDTTAQKSQGVEPDELLEPKPHAAPQAGGCSAVPGAVSLSWVLLLVPLWWRRRR